MTLTLRQALEFEPFVQARARVLTGAERLDRSVRWVHCSEMPEAARLFHGGELYLTQGRGLCQRKADQRGWVNELADADVAGVGIEIGVVIDAVPETVINAADERRLPIIELTTPAYFMSMTQHVHSAILDSQVAMLRRAEEVGRRFARLALRGAGMQAILDQLGSVVAAPVVLADSLHQILGYAPKTDTTVAMLAQWPAHARQGHQYADNDGGAETATSGGLTCTCQPIVFRGELWGSVHVLHGSHRMDEVGQLSLDRAAAAIGLTFAAADGEQRHDDDARSALIQDLIYGHGGEEPVRQRLRGLGLPVGSAMRMLLFQPIERTDPTQARVRSSRELRATLRAVASRLTRGLGDAGRSVLYGYDGARLIVLVSGRIPDQELTEIARHACRTGADGLGDPDLLVGVSGEALVESLPRAASETEDAVRYGLATGAGREVLLARRLGIGRLLLKLDEGSALSDHIEAVLGRLLNHDASSPTPLLPTLVAYLELFGNKSDVARRLHIARRSLYHRLDRIRALVDIDLDDAEARLQLMIAVAGLRLRERANRARLAAQSAKSGPMT
jgi:PucR family transcriptional regulator, purine catabolism regulatory protein